MDNRSRRTRIIVAIIVSFFLSRILLNRIFLAKSPRIQPNLIGKYIAAISETTSNWFKVSKPRNNDLTSEGFVLRGKGIYTKTDQSTISVMVKEQEVDWTDYSFNIKGQTIIVKVPKGENPPTQNFMEQMY